MFPIRNMHLKQKFTITIFFLGNGPSGIVLSYMLSGNIPYIISSDHPDEMLSVRLKPYVGESLLDQNLDHLASGLEGRTTNEISLLMDALLQPCADAGFELEPLVEFRKIGKEVSSESFIHLDNFRNLRLFFSGII